MSYAVYVVVIEDTEEGDMELATHVESMERVEGDLLSGEAEDLIVQIRATYGE